MWGCAMVIEDLGRRGKVEAKGLSGGELLTAQPVQRAIPSLAI